MIKELLRGLPKVDPLLESKRGKRLSEEFTRERVKLTLRDSLSFFREGILNKDVNCFISDNDILNKTEETLRKSFEKSLKKVVNATGIVIHTNLGRSILSENAAYAVYDIAKNYSTLEYNLKEGKRGSRYSHVETIINEITGAKSCMVVNNNAAAVMLILNEFGKGKEAIVSRGELVEIGGNFRIPEVMEYAGAILKEVGATNRTHIEDYEKAINENTGVLLKVHSSNYRIVGFTKEVSSLELAKIGKKYNVPTYEDLGSGILVDLGENFKGEKTVKKAISSGVNIVSFSGDKMLGGPQAGIIVGDSEYIDRLKKNPLTRALRVDKFTLAALLATLLDYLRSDRDAIIPTLQMINQTGDEIHENANELFNMLSKLKDYNFKISKDISFVGGGAMPSEEFETYVIETRKDVVKLERLLRDRKIPIIARVRNNKLMFDLRTIRKDEFEIIFDALKEIGDNL